MKRTILFILLVLFIFNSFDLNSQDKINENNFLENKTITIPIRVFQNNKSVKSLNIGELSLFIDNLKTEIIKIKKISKKLKQTSKKNRAFVFIFHIADYKHKMANAIEKIFSIINTGDRIMLVSNSTLLNNLIVENKVKLKKKFKNILRNEENIFKSELYSLRNRLYEGLKSNKGSTYNPHFPYYTNRTSNGIVRYRKLFLLLDKDKINKISNFLNKNNKDKWVFSFIQSESFYIRSTGFTRNMIKKTQIKRMDLLTVFFNSKAIFNTLLFKKANMPRVTNSTEGTYYYTKESGSYSISSVKRNLPFGYKYRYNKNINPLSLKDDFIELSNKTGGIVFRSDNVDKFFDKIKKNEDIVYDITFKNKKNLNLRDKKIKIISTNKEYKIVYNEFL